MTFFSPRMASGVVRDDPGLAAEGAYLSTDKVRLRLILKDILPEIIGGWEKATQDTVSGKARALHVWEDLDGQKVVAIGTHKKLYIYTGGLLWDITPVRDDSVTSGTLSDPFDTVDTDATVTVNHTAHGVISGDTVYLKADAVGGVTFGAAGTYSSNPIQTVENSDFIIVTHTSHGLTSGEYVTLASASATGGIAAASINKTHRVYVLSDDAFQIQVATSATSTATGGGTPTYVYFHGFEATYVDANSYTVEARSAATSTVTGGGGTTSWWYELNIGLENTTRTAGYSTGTYSSGLYSLPSTGSDLRARVWHFSNFGQNLLANYRESPLYRWQNNLSQSAAAVAATDAPAKNLSHMVTPERFIVTLGTEDAATSTFDTMRYAFATQEGGFTTNDWTPAATNTAGDKRLAEGTRIVRGLAMPQISLIWTDTALYGLQYLQDTTLVFGDSLLGTGCGLIGPNAMTRVADVGAVIWLSSSQRFFIWNGGAPQMIPCPVRDYLFDNLAAVQEDLIFAGHNSRWNEVWWFYPSAETNENAAYVVYNYRDNLWYIGTFTITAWGDLADSGFPIAVDADGTVQFYERPTGTDNGDAISWHFETAPVDIEDGDRVYMIDRFMPDNRDLVGGCTLIMKSRFWANGTETTTTVGTFNSATQSLAFRAKGRQISYRIEGNSAPAKGRFGRPTFNVKPGGERR